MTTNEELSEVISRLFDDKATMEEFRVILRKYFNEILKEVFK